MTKVINTVTFYCPNCGVPLNIDVSPFIIKIECHECNKFYIKNIGVNEIDISQLLEDAVLHYFRDIVECKVSEISV